MMLSFKDIQTYLFSGYGAIVLKVATKSICKVTFKQKPWKQIIEQGKGKTKTELVKEKIRELSKNFSFYPSRNYKI